MDARSTRAHACQILNTVAAIAPDLSLSLVLPKYHSEIDFEVIKKNHDLSDMPAVFFLKNFGIQKSGIAAFALFNIPSALFLFKNRIMGRLDYVYFRTSYFIPIAILALILRVPVFYETHRRPVSWSERQRDYLMSKIATGIVVISRYMEEHYLPYRKNILVVHDSVSLKRFAVAVDKKSARERFDIGQDEKVCVYAGTISKLKGIDHLISAAKILPNVSFLLAGIVSKEFQGVELPSNVRVLGRLEQKDLPIFLQSADVLILPHPKGEYSQSPMKLFEYMASRIPIVASRLPSLTEVLNDENSVLVEPENPEALVEGITKILNDTNNSKVIADRAFDDVKNYTWDKRGEHISAFIRKTVSGVTKNLK